MSHGHYTGSGSTLTFACAFKLAVLEAAVAQNNRDRQTTRNSPKKAVFRLTETMLIGSRCLPKLDVRINAVMYPLTSLRGQFTFTKQMGACACSVLLQFVVTALPGFIFNASDLCTTSFAVQVVASAHIKKTTLLRPLFSHTTISYI